jgi:hypothetical protein
MGQGQGGVSGGNGKERRAGQREGERTRGDTSTQDEIARGVAKRILKRDQPAGEEKPAGAQPLQNGELDVPGLDVPEREG